MKLLTILCLMLMSVITASAQKITPEQAMHKAEAFASQRRALQSKGQKAAQLQLKQIEQQMVLSETTDTQLFMYNIGENNGFVIISGDERTPEVLGYADTGCIDPENMPENMRAWMEMYAHDIALLQASQSTVKYAVPHHQAIAPMVTAKWDQDAPYNLKCPKKLSKYCYTGCVATAMAQVLYYVRPEGCKAIKKRDIAPAIEATTFNWSIMKDTYSSDDTSESAQEVAKLMRYCGQAAGMEYGTDASGALSNAAADGLKKYFNISNSCHLIERNYCTSNTWDDIIYNELANNRPFLVSGVNMEGGHEFLCDGYDGEGCYHINWGWSGYSNGYFYMNALSPDSQGIGGSSSGYSSGIDAIIGIKLKDSTESDDNVSVLIIKDLNVASTSFTRNSNGTFTLNTKYTFYNMNNDGVTRYNYCWGVFNANDELVQTSTVENATLIRGLGLNVNSIVVGADLPDGTYQLKFISCQSDAKTWALSDNADFFAITLDINGNTATITPPQVSGNNESYSISDVSITGNGLINRVQRLEMTVRNTGNTFCGNIFAIDTKTKTIIGSMAINIDPGEAETVVGDVIFTQSGTRTVGLYKEVDNGYSPISNETYTFEAFSESYTSLTLSAKPATSYTMQKDIYVINESMLKMDCTIKNASAKDYRSSILYYYDGNDGYLYMASDNPSYVPAGQTVVETHQVMPLEEDVIYDIYLSYYSAMNVKPPFYEKDKIRVMYSAVPTGIQSVSATAADDAIYTIDGRRVTGSANTQGNTPAPALPHGLYIKGGKKYVY